MQPSRALSIAAGMLLASNAAAVDDPLPSWNEGAAKRSIIAFVTRVTSEGRDFVPPQERVAVFDNDGTLWSEQPVYFQIAFAFDQVKQLAPRNPEWKSREPFRSVLAGDMKAFAATGEKGVLEVIAATHSGMTSEEFTKTVSDWFAGARHPKTGRLYADMVYQPMREVLQYLRANGFKTFIVSGGGVEFMRPMTERLYGIPPEQVVGSRIQTRFELRGGTPVLVREAGVDFVDDGPGKPVGIQSVIGRRPMMAFGNSDGDLQMLQWTTAGPGPRFALIVHHTDGEREWAYDNPSSIGRLDRALVEGKAKGWTIVDMKQDWKKIYPFDR